MFLILYLFPENILFVFIIIIFFLDSSKTHLLPYPSNFVSSMFLTLFYLACVTFHWSLGNLPVDIDLKETYSPSLRNYLLLMERFETYGSPPISIVASGMSFPRSFVPFHRHCVHRCSSSFYRKKNSFLVIIHHLWLLNFSYTSSKIIYEFGEE